MTEIYYVSCSLIGVKCAVLEKSRNFSKHPQAHFINNRTMEVEFLMQKIKFSGLPGKISFHLKCVILGVPQIGWPGGGDPDISTTSRIMEKVCILYFSLWFSSRIGGPHATSRCSLSL